MGAASPRPKESSAQRGKLCAWRAFFRKKRAHLAQWFGKRLGSTRPRITSRRVCSQLRAWPPQGKSSLGRTIAWHPQLRMLVPCVSLSFTVEDILLLGILFVILGRLFSGGLPFSFEPLSKTQHGHSPSCIAVRSPADARPPTGADMMYCSASSSSYVYPALTGLHWTFEDQEEEEDSTRQVPHHTLPSRAPSTHPSARSSPHAYAVPLCITEAPVRFFHRFGVK